MTLPYEQGYEAANDLYVENPYPYGSHDWAEWEIGLEDALNDDEELVDSD